MGATGKRTIFLRAQIELERSENPVDWLMDPAEALDGDQIEGAQAESSSPTGVCPTKQSIGNPDASSAWSSAIRAIMAASMPASSACRSYNVALLFTMLPVKVGHWCPDLVLSEHAQGLMGR